MYSLQKCQRLEVSGNIHNQKYNVQPLRACCVPVSLIRFCFNFSLDLCLKSLYLVDMLRWSAVLLVVFLSVVREL
jgi:hypothetical protein